MTTRPKKKRQLRPHSVVIPGDWFLSFVTQLRGDILTEIDLAVQAVPPRQFEPRRYNKDLYIKIRKIITDLTTVNVRKYRFIYPTRGGTEVWQEVKWRDLRNVLSDMMLPQRPDKRRRPGSNLSERLDKPAKKKPDIKTQL